MPRATTTILLFLVSHFLVSQTFYKESDSLYNEGKYQEALEKINLAIEENANNPIYHQLKASSLYNLRQIEAAAESYLMAITLEEKKEEPDDDFMAQTNYWLGECYHSLGQFYAAIRRYYVGLSYKSFDKMGADLKYNLSTAYARLGQYDSAMTYLEYVYTYDLQHGDSSDISSDLNALAYMHTQKREWEKALDYHKQSMSYVDPSNHRMLAIRYSNIGATYTQLRQFEEAEKNLRESLRIYVELRDSVKAMSQFVNLSTMYKDMGLMPKALDYLKRADAFFVKQGNNKWVIIRTKLQLADAYYQSGRYAQGLEQTEIMLSLSKEEKLLEEVVRTLDMRVKLFEAMNNTPSAYSTLKEVLKYSDSLNTKQQLNELNELELRFVSEAKEKEIEVLELENRLKEASLDRKNQQQLILIVGILLIIVIALIFFIIQRKNYRLKEELLSQEIDTLRVKIDSIFGGGVKSLDMTLDDLNKGLFRPLSEREFEILNEAISDKNNREIADSLFLSVNTVKYHIRNIYEKLGVSNRKEALEFIISRS